MRLDIELMSVGTMVPRVKRLRRESINIKRKEGILFKGFLERLWGSRDLLEKRGQGREVLKEKVQRAGCSSGCPIGLLRA